LSPAFEAFSLSNADMIASSQSVDGLIISASPAVQRFGEIEVLMRDNGVNKLLDISSPNISNRCGCGATFG
jgi:Fe-S cluster assembly iron-binding protein IscA